MALSFFHIGTFADGVKDFSPLGRGVYLPEFSLVGDLPKSGSQVCRNVWPGVITMNMVNMQLKLCAFEAERSQMFASAARVFFVTKYDLRAYVFIDPFLTNRRTKGSVKQSIIR